jgi:hypothetical protein
MTALNKRRLDDFIESLENIWDRLFAVFKFEDTFGSNQDFCFLVVCAYQSLED